MVLPTQPTQQHGAAGLDECELRTRAVARAHALVARARERFQSQPQVQPQPQMQPGSAGTPDRPDAGTARAPHEQQQLQSTAAHISADSPRGEQGGASREAGQVGARVGSIDCENGKQQHSGTAAGNRAGNVRPREDGKQIAGYMAGRSWARETAWQPSQTTDAARPRKRSRTGHMHRPHGDREGEDTGMVIHVGGDVGLAGTGVAGDGGVGPGVELEGNRGVGDCEGVGLLPPQACVSGEAALYQHRETWGGGEDDAVGGEMGAAEHAGSPGDTEQAQVGQSWAVWARVWLWPFIQPTAR